LLAFLTDNDFDKLVTGGSGESDSLAYRRLKVQEQVSSWVNQSSLSEEGFTALHFASFYGNIRMIRLLVANGANIYAVNKLGINMVHVAA
jgi:hypothetical protein